MTLESTHMSTDYGRFERQSSIASRQPVVAAKTFGFGPAKHLRRLATGFDVICVTCGAILITSACLKAYQLTTETQASEGFLGLPVIRFALAECESLLGVWLISRLFPRSLRFVSICVFTGFAFVSMSEATLGHSSCGCFGALKVNPWFTFAFDVVAVSFLSICRPLESGLELRRAPLGISIIAGAVWFAMFGAPFFGVIWLQKHAIEGGNKAKARIDFDPRTSIGRPCSLIKDIKSADRMGRGTWLVLFYRPDCSVCRDALSLFDDLAKDFGPNAQCPALAAVDCLNTASLMEPTCRSGEVFRTRFSAASPWKMSTPVIVLLGDAKTEAVFDFPQDKELFRKIWDAGATTTQPTRR
jgi:hypothetical protein